LAAALVVACLLNGAVAYLSRIGVIERAAFDSYVSTYCRLPAPVRFPTFTCACMQDPGWPDSRELPSNEHLFRTDGFRFWPKLAKDLLIASILLVGAGAWLRRRPTDATRRATPPLVLALFALVVAAGGVHALASDGPLLALLGMRPFAFVAVALLSGWAAAGLPVLARGLVVLLLVECVLVAVEFAFGMPMRACPRFFRAAGTMVLPSSLGTLSVCCVAFGAAHGLSGKRLGIAVAASVVLVLAAGSGTGVALLLALAAWLAWRVLPDSRRLPGIAAGLVVVAALIFALPWLTHRPDVWNSVVAPGGRIDTLGQVVRVNSPVQTLLGHGLAKGTNLATNLEGRGLASSASPLRVQAPFHADSTVTMLFVQLGLVGVIAFCGLLAWAWRVDPGARPFYLVAAIASLTINLPEAFPLNVLLGLALARSALVAAGKPSLAQHTRP
jgi:hypothetical protein